MKFSSIAGSRVFWAFYFIFLVTEKGGEEKLIASFCEQSNL